MPNTQSQEKVDLLRILGADVRPVPAVPFDDPQNYNHQARRHAEATTNGAACLLDKGQWLCNEADTPPHSCVDESV